MLESISAIKDKVAKGLYQRRPYYNFDIGEIMEELRQDAFYDKFPDDQLIEYAIEKGLKEYDKKTELIVSNLKKQEKFKNYTEDQLYEYAYALQGHDNMGIHMATMHTYTDHSKPNDPIWGGFSYEEILQMEAGGVEIPEDILAWAHAEQDANSYDYQVEQDGSEDQNTVENLGNTTNTDDQASVQKKAQAFSSQAEAQKNVIAEKTEEIQPQAQNVTDKQEDLQEAQKDSISKTEELMTEWKLLDQKAKSGTLTENEKRRYNELAQILSNDNNNFADELEKLSQDIDELMAQMNDINLLIDINDKINAELEDTSVRMAGYEGSKRRGYLGDKKDLGNFGTPDEMFSQAMSGNVGNNTALAGKQLNIDNIDIKLDQDKNVSVTEEAILKLEDAKRLVQDSESNEDKPDIIKNVDVETKEEKEEKEKLNNAKNPANGNTDIPDVAASNTTTETEEDTEGDNQTAPAKDGEAADNEAKQETIVMSPINQANTATDKESVNPNATNTDNANQKDKAGTQKAENGLVDNSPYTSAFDNKNGDVNNNTILGNGTQNINAVNGVLGGADILDRFGLRPQNLLLANTLLSMAQPTSFADKVQEIIKNKNNDTQNPLSKIKTVIAEVAAKKAGQPTFADKVKNLFPTASDEKDTPTLVDAIRGKAIKQEEVKTDNVPENNTAENVTEEATSPVTNAGETPNITDGAELTTPNAETTTPTPTAPDTETAATTPTTPDAEAATTTTVVTTAPEQTTVEAGTNDTATAATETSPEAKQVDDKLAQNQDLASKIQKILKGDYNEDDDKSSLATKIQSMIKGASAAKGERQNLADSIRTIFDNKNNADGADSTKEESKVTTGEDTAETSPEAENTQVTETGNTPEASQVTPTNTPAAAQGQDDAEEKNIESAIAENNKNAAKIDALNEESASNSKEIAKSIANYGSLAEALDRGVDEVGILSQFNADKLMNNNLTPSGLRVAQVGNLNTNTVDTNEKSNIEIESAKINQLSNNISKNARTVDRTLLESVTNLFNYKPVSISVLLRYYSSVNSLLMAVAGKIEAGNLTNLSNIIQNNSDDTLTEDKDLANELNKNTQDVIAENELSLGIEDEEETEEEPAEEIPVPEVAPETETLEDKVVPAEVDENSTEQDIESDLVDELASDSDENAQMLNDYSTKLAMEKQAQEVAKVAMSEPASRGGFESAASATVSMEQKIKGDDTKSETGRRRRFVSYEDKNKRAALADKIEDSKRVVMKRGKKKNS